MTLATETKTATRNGVTLRYNEAGAGEPALLFVHGWTCNRTHWRDQFPHFAKKHHVIAVDLRGHGESDKPDEDYSITGFADDLAWFINELNPERPVVIGHSMGGSIAMNLARRYPDLTSAIIMIDSPIMPLPEAMEPLVPQLLAGFETPGYNAVAEAFARQTFFDTDTDPALLEEIISMMGTTQRVTLTAFRDILTSQNEAAGPIPVPALFIRARTAYATEDQLRQHIPGMGIVTVPAGHFLQMEQPAATNNIISDFLDKLE